MESENSHCHDDGEKEGPPLLELLDDDPSMLPIADFKEKVLDLVLNGAQQVLVLTSETGSGKTTQIPQYLADDKRIGGAGVVAVTQPRRVAATSVAKRVAEERGVKLGGEVGYRIRFDDCSSASTRIKYLTDGMLIREAMDDPELKQYSCVMLDEAHERTVNTDILFGVLKRALAMRPALRAVVTSATLDIERFSSFFGGCPSIVIPGRNFPVDIYHSKTKQIMTAAGPASTSYVKSAVDTALQIHMTQGPGHILVFLTGQEEIDSAVRMIHDGADKLRSSETMQACVLPLYGLLSSAAQSHVFEPVGRHVRKIIVCTNIAETSLTVPGVSFVVDAGYVKQKAYDPRRRMESLVVVPISQSAAQQRSGRAGRTGHGQCYRMYSSECYATMMKEMIPEIRRCSLSNTVLYLKAIGIVDVIGFEYLDPPDEDQLADALLLLYWLGALDRGGIITTRGREMARFPIEPCLARAVLASAKRGCSNEMLTIAAMLSVESLWEHTSKNQKVEAEHAKLRHPHGDTLTYLTIFEEWMASGCSERWARERFLRTRALATAKKIRHQLAQEFFRAGLPVESSCGSDFAKIRRSLCEAYFMNAGQSCAKQSVYRSLPLPGVTGNDLKLMHLHPTCSLLNGNEPPEAVIYIELVSGGRPYMRHVTAVETRWIRRLVDEVSTSTVTISTLCGRSPLTPLPEQKQEPNRVAAQACPAGGSICTEEDRRAQAIVAAKLRFLKRKVPG